VLVTRRGKPRVRLTPTGGYCSPNRAGVSTSAGGRSDGSTSPSDP
jgi:hypothetical protein